MQPISPISSVSLVDVLRQCQLKSVASSEVYKLIEEKIKILGKNQRALSKHEQPIFFLAQRIVTVGSSKESFQKKLFQLLKQVKEEEEEKLPAGLTMDQKWNLNRLADHPDDLESHFNVVCTLHPNQEITHRGRKFDKRTLFQDLLRRNPQDPDANFGYAESLKGEESIPYYLMAIKYNPQFSRSYCQLSFTLPKGHSILFQDGRNLNQQQLFLEALKWDAKYAEPYYGLSLLLSTYESVDLPDKRSLRKFDLYLEILKYDSHFSYAYSGLGENYYCRLYMGPRKEVELPDGRFLNQKELFFEALKWDANNHEAYHGLALLLQEGERVELLDGTEMSSSDLRFKAFELKFS